MSLYFFRIKLFNQKNMKEKTLPGSNFQTLHFNIQGHIPHKETPRCARLSAVFTLEAALLMPLLASFFVSILFFFRVMQIELEVQKALDDTGRLLAVYLADEGDSAVGFVTAKVLFGKEMADRETAKQYISGGFLGISLAESEFTANEIHLKACYQIKLPIRLFWSWEFPMQQRADCRKWTGWSPAGENESTDEWVYITETGTVYHTNSTCTHLNLSIQSVNYSQVSGMRNENGGKYEECILCAEKAAIGGHVYITNQGDCYHYDLNCSGIKRTVQMVRLSEVGARRKCTRCMAQGG